MYTFMKKATRVLLTLVLILGGLALTGSLASAAAVSIDLCASDGSITMPDSTVVPVWGFVQTASCAGGLVNDTNFPGPVIDVNEGDVVTINLTSALPAGHTASFELAGLPVTLPGPGQYEFTASRAGTFSFQSPGNSGRQAAMGLYGALIVRTSTPGQAYGTPASAYDVEATLVLSQLDPAFNAAPDTFDMSDYLATYWLINGKAYPQTAPIVAAEGQRVLVRYVNAGYDNTTMLLLGMHEQVIARDAYLLNNPFLADAETIPAGGTEDVIVTVVSYASATGVNGFPLYNRQLHVTNGSPSANPGGMITFFQQP